MGRNFIMGLKNKKRLLAGKAPSSKSSDAEETIQQQVLNQNSLLERIISYAIYDNTTGEISRNNLKSLRLVKKNWLEAVTTCLAKLEQPLFQLSLTKENSVLGTQYVSKNGKLIDQFVTAMKSRGKDAIPLFSLHLQPSYFRQENNQSLLNCLTHCGSALVTLRLSFPKKSTMTFNFPPFSLPNLKKVTVHFSNDKLCDWSLAGTANLAASTAIYLIQSILSSSKALTSLQFSASGAISFSLPFGIETLRLPSSLTSIIIACPPSTCSDWKFLCRNSLPKLTHLTLSVGKFTRHGTQCDKLVHRIFQNLQKSLTCLELNGVSQQELQNGLELSNPTPINFQFPPMKNLTSVKITCHRWQLSDHVVRLQECLPKLSTLVVINQTEDMFRKWTEYANSSVRTVAVSIVNDDLPKGHSKYTVPFSVEKMQRLHFAFDNLINLNVTLCGEEIFEGLEYLFSKMILLERLTITVKGSGENVSCDQWDGLLIGAPKEMACMLRENPDYWDNIQFTDHERIPSLRKLTKLKTLGLIEALCFDLNTTIYLATPSPPLISDVTFHFALLRMPNLKNLFLTGRFEVSDQMKQEWTTMKGTRIRSV